MTMHFTVLASGSAGNANLVEAYNDCVLIDVGIGPRTLATRLATVNRTWKHLRAVFLTHVHTDHWKETTLVHLAKNGIPLHCHPEHQRYLAGHSLAFDWLEQEGLVRLYQANQVVSISSQWHCLPIAVSHDSGETFGFRFEAEGLGESETSRLGYLTDLGCWDDSLADAMTDVDLLALEFNHDVAMERNSGRSPDLIRRVLGDQGHLSNAQAAAFVREILRRSSPGRLKTLIQLHLSKECNHPHLAAKTARQCLSQAACEAELYSACQESASPRFSWRSQPNGKVSEVLRNGATVTRLLQAKLPGFE
jgi:phosphoribosyl 1,2-cyclic phosphodiesterase